MSLLLAQLTDSPKPRNAMAGVVKIGYLKKNKNMRKKFFVLREETAGGGPARLEYYETEKKWRNNAMPKKVIVLKSCFNIDKRVDARTKKTLICLYTKESSFYIQFDSDKERDEWLDLMLVLQRVTKDFGPGVSLKEPFEHIWHISILKKELGMNANLIGMTGLCLCDKKVSIMKYPTKSKEQKSMDIMLSSIRRCGALGTFFYMEVGQSSPFGSGHIWMDTWNNDVATSVHETIMGASSRNHDPRFRMRSSSFNEGSRLINNYPIRQRSSCFYDENHPGLRYKNNSQSSSTLNNGNIDLTRAVSVRERCDSMPLRPRTISENTTSSTRSFNGILSPKQTFHKGCNCVSASSSLSAFNDSNLSTWDSSLSKSTDTTDGISSFYTSLNDHRSAILEEKQEDFVSYTPLDKEEDSLRQTSDSYVNNNINLINNNIVGNKSSSSSQAGSCDSNSPYGSPINVDDTYTPLNPSGTSETSPPPDGYLPMKPGYTFSSNCVNVMPLEGHSNSKQEPTEMPQTEFESPEGYVPMAPVGRMSDYVSMDCKQGSIESGTPSTDTRFSDIHLDKVCAYLTPSEDEGPIERPTRAYSVGSRPDGLREKIDKLADRTRTRAFSVGSRGRLPPTGLPRNGYQSGSTSMSEHSDSGDRMEIDFSCNSKSRRHYSATCRNLSIQPPADLSPRSSPKLCPSPDPSYTHRPTGRSPPKSIVSSVDIKRSLSGAVHGISRSPPTSSHTYLSPTLERVSEVPGIELVDSYTPMKPSQGLLPCENTSLVVEESNKKNYVNVWEAASSTFPLMKMIGGLNWKKNKKRNTAPVLEQLVPMADEGIDEVDGYTTIRPGVMADEGIDEVDGYTTIRPGVMADEGIDEVDGYTTIRPGAHTIPVREQRVDGQSSDAVLDAICDGLADIVFSDPSHIVTYNSQNHSKSDNSVTSLDG